MIRRRGFRNHQEKTSRMTTSKHLVGGSQAFDASFKPGILGGGEGHTPEVHGFMEPFFEGRGFMEHPESSFGKNAKMKVSTYV